jgi:hypothetical protein
MIDVVKRFGTVSLILFYAFILTAQVSVVFGASANICPGGSFNALCDLNANNFSTIIGNILQILLIIAVVLSVIFLIWGGIKWVMSGGDKGAVESARSTIIAAIIGLVIAFAAFFLVTIVLQLFGISQDGVFQIPTLLSNVSSGTPPCNVGDPGYPRC